MADVDQKSVRFLQDNNDDSNVGNESEWQEPLFPWTSILCLVYLGVLSLVMLAGLLTAEISPRYDNVNPEELWHAKVAVLLIVSSFVTEMCFLASSATNACVMGGSISAQLQLNRLGDSMLTLLEYGTKFLTGVMIWLYDGWIIHADTLAIGGQRPVYLARFVQWALGVPTLILITNRSFTKHSSGYTMILRSGPCALASFLFCCAAWLMEVTTSSTVRWTMLCMCLIGHIVTSMDQAKLALTHRHEPLIGWKVGMLIYQIASFTAYAILFCCGRFGLISSLTEQGIYAYSDATIKVFQGAILAIIRNREDLVAIRHWWTTALSVSQDLEALIKKARVPVFAIDADLKIMEWNSTLEELTGLTMSDLKGRPLIDIVDAESREILQQVCNNVIKSTELDEKAVSRQSYYSPVVASSAWSGNFVEISIPIQNGPVQARQLAMTLVPKSTNTCELSGIVGIGQDLSDIAQLKIIQERKSALMAMLSHEIRSPLHGMMGLTGAMLEQEETKAFSRQLGMIKGCAARLLDLVTNIMDLAQQEKRKRDGRPAARPTQPVNFAMIAEEVTMMTNMAVDKVNKPLLRSSVRLVNKMIGVKVPMIKGDPQKCTQLLYNLVTNACKFTDRGTVTMQARHLKDENKLEVDVVDTGKGISKEGQKRIFGAFEQEENGTTQNFQGIGLGLAVCTEIADLHGGELRVHSEVGKGSTFTASFPCAVELGFGTCEPLMNTPATPPSTKPTSASKTAPGPRSAPPNMSADKQLVLSVDDDEVNQEVVRGALKGLCDIYCAMSGHEAIKFLESRRAQNKKLPDTVLLDIQMPGMDGFEVCDEIRKRFENAHSRMPIIMISAKAPTEEAAIQSFTMGTTDFVAKPFNTEVLRRKVGVVLKAKGEFDLGGATTTVAKEAHLRLIDTTQRLQEETDRSKVLVELGKESDRKVKELQAKLDEAEAKIATLMKRGDDLKRKNDDLELQSASLRKDTQVAKQLPTATDASIGDAAAKAATAAAEKAMEAERQRAKAAETRREEAERKVLEMSNRVELLTQTLKTQESMLHSAPMQRSAAVGLPVQAIGAARSKSSTSTACSVEEVTNGVQAGYVIQQGDLVEQQRHIIRAMIQQMCGAKSVIRALTSRIEILNAIARGCADVLRMQPASSASVLILDGVDEDQQELARVSELDWFRTVTPIIGAQLSMMESMSMPPQDLADVAKHVENAVAQLCDGKDEISPMASDRS